MVIPLLGVIVGATAITIAAWREYLYRKAEPILGILKEPNSAPTTGLVEAVPPAPPAPAPSPAPAPLSSAEPVASARVSLAPRRYGGNYVRRAAPKRSTTTRQRVDDAPS